MLPNFGSNLVIDIEKIALKRQINLKHKLLHTVAFFCETYIQPNMNNVVFTCNEDLRY